METRVSLLWYNARETLKDFRDISTYIYVYCVYSSFIDSLTLYLCAFNEQQKNEMLNENLYIYLLSVYYMP